ncbi:MAG: HypC/HybG/HupF family hydrogenase formation chaperone [Dehalococcoidia bacterium]
MCQAIPREVLQVGNGRAEVLIDGRPTWVIAQALPELRAGEFILVYAGQALEWMERDEAELLLREITDLDAMFDALMPDGGDREPACRVGYEFGEG